MKKNAGFTLIELVIVIIVLGILSAVAIPKFVALQNDAKRGAMQGLNGALETGATLTYTQAKIEGVSTEHASRELSSGLKIRYGYPQASATHLKSAVDLNDDWRLSSDGSSNSTKVNFTFPNDSEGMTVLEIENSVSICKLVYNQAEKGERPLILISGCAD